MRPNRSALFSGGGGRGGNDKELRAICTSAALFYPFSNSDDTFANSGSLSESKGLVSTDSAWCKSVGRVCVTSAQIFSSFTAAGLSAAFKNCTLNIRWMQLGVYAKEKCGCETCRLGLGLHKANVWRTKVLLFIVGHHFYSIIQTECHSLGNWNIIWINIKYYSGSTVPFLQRWHIPYYMSPLIKLPSRHRRIREACARVALQGCVQISASCAHG